MTESGRGLLSLSSRLAAKADCLLLPVRQPSPREQEYLGSAWGGGEMNSAPDSGLQLGCTGTWGLGILSVAQEGEIQLRDVPPQR